MNDIIKNKTNIQDITCIERKVGGHHYPSALLPSEEGRACGTPRSTFLVGSLTLTLCAQKGELSSFTEEKLWSAELKDVGSWL